MTANVEVQGRDAASSRRVPWNDGFGVMGSERRASFATGVPERDNLEKISSYPIVEKVSNSGEV